MITEAEKVELNLDTIEDIPNIGPVRARALRNAGYTTKHHILCSWPNEIVEITQMDRDEAAQVIEYTRTLLEDAGLIGKRWMTFADLEKERAQIQRIKSGSNALDELLTGGLECKSITEFFGKFGSGKTQAAFSYAIQAQLPIADGGLRDGDRPVSVIFVDTESTARPERTRQIVIARKLVKSDDEKRILEFQDGIIYHKVLNAGHLMVTINNMMGYIRESNVRLIIIDSGTALHRSEMIGRGVLAAKQQMYGIMLAKLRRYAEVFNLAVIFNNQVYNSPTEQFTGETNPEFAVGGNTVAHGTTYRVQLKRASRLKMVAKMVDSPMSGQDTCFFALDEKGISDFVPKKKDTADE